MRPPVLTPEASGVYRTPPESVALRERVRAGGGRWLEADFRGVSSRHALLETLARAASFPPYFGFNWDALADALQDLAPASPVCVLHLRETKAAQAALAADWMTLLEILEQAAMYWKGRSGAFVALIDDASSLPVWR